MVDGQNFSYVLSQFARILTAESSVSVMLRHLAEQVVATLPIDAASLTLHAPGLAASCPTALDEASHRWGQLQRRASGDGPTGETYRSGSIVAVPDVRADDRFPSFRTAALGAGLAAVFAVPLGRGDCRMGTLDLYRSTSGALSPTALATAQTLADVTAAHVLNARSRDVTLPETTDHDPIHDLLTTLPNRMLLRQRLEQVTRRLHPPAAALFVDLDWFRQVNGEHGHQIGDQLLFAVAGRLSALIRPTDTLARVSRDAFVLLCEDLESAADIKVLATRLGAALTAPFLLERHQVTVSARVGIAYAGPGEEVSERLIDDAKQAMQPFDRTGSTGQQISDPAVLDLDRQPGRNHGDRSEEMAAVGTSDAFASVVRRSDGVVPGLEALLRESDPPPPIAGETSHPNRGAGY